MDEQMNQKRKSRRNGYGVEFIRIRKATIHNELNALLRYRRRWERVSFIHARASNIH